MQRRDVEKQSEARRRHYMVFALLALWMVLAASFISSRKASKAEAEGPRIEPPSSQRYMAVESTTGFAANR